MYLPNVLSWKVLVFGVVAAYVVRRQYRRRVRDAKNRQWAVEHHCSDGYELKNWDPIFGLDLFYTILKTESEGNVLEFFESIWKKSGFSTVKWTVFGRTGYLTLEPENVKAILATQFEDFGMEELRKSMRKLFGVGIFTSDGEVWHRSRNMLRPVFSRTQLDMSLFESHVDRLISHIPRDGATVDLQPLFYRMTLDSATDFLVGQSTNTLSSETKNTDAANFGTVFDRATEHMATAGGYGGLGALLFGNRYHANIKFIHGFVDSLISKAVAEKQQRKLSSGQSRFVFLHELLAETDDHIQIRTEVLNLLLAGRDTTAEFLTNIFYELPRHPAVLSRLLDEINSLPANEPLTFESLKNMTYLRAVLNEGLRVHPVVPGNARIAVRNTTLPHGGGPDGKTPLFIPEGAITSWSAQSIHRRQDIFGPDADDFVPERWLDEGDRRGVRPGWGFVPFNGGPRVCIGQQFALAQASYTVVRILREVAEIEVRDNRPWKERVLLTMRNANGCKLGMKFKQ